MPRGVSIATSCCILTFQDGCFAICAALGSVPVIDMFLLRQMHLRDAYLAAVLPSSRGGIRRGYREKMAGKGAGFVFFRDN